MAELRVPPGRAGRLWLTERLDTAQRAAALLDRKLRILCAEQERVGALAQSARVEWARVQSAADLWLARAGVVGGQRAIRLATPTTPAEIGIAWESLMGVRYPTTATSIPADHVDGSTPGSAVIVQATTEYERALNAAAAYAVAVAASRIIDTEVAATRRRSRAIAKRWIPRLESALHDRTEQLEEAERAEAVQLHWATTRVEPDRPQR